MLLVGKDYVGKANRLSNDGATSSGTWTTVFTWDTSGGTADDVGWSGYTFVWTLPLAAFSATGGTQIRLTFDGASTEGYIANAVYVGNGGGGDAYDFGDTPVQMLMSGGATITVGAAATDVVTDAIAFVKDSTNPFVLAMQFSDGAHDNLFRTAGGTTAAAYYKNAADAATQNKSGYSAHFTAHYVKKIELLI